MKAITILLAAGFTALSALSAEIGYSTLISHRGESHDAPENTLAAFKTAVSRGFGFECDVYLSKDGKVFSFHDSTLSRTTGGANKKKCRDATWDELSKLDVGSWGPWAGSKFKGERPALLEEILALAKNGRWIYVEIKTGPEIVPYIADIVKKQKKATKDNVLFISFNAKTCAAVKKALPQYKVLLVTSGRGEDGTVDGLLKRLKDCNADGADVHFKSKVVTAESVKAIRDAGFEFHVWTVDKLDDTLNAFKCGVQTVTTNCAKKQLDESRKTK